MTPGLQTAKRIKFRLRNFTEHPTEPNLETRKRAAAWFGPYNGSVLDAEMRQRLGGADVHGRERRAHDAEQQPQVVPPRGARVRRCRGRRRARELELAAHPLAPPLPPRAGARGRLRIRALHERRERLPRRSLAPPQ